MTTTLQTIALNQIEANPWQPRAALDPERVKELADSIMQVGLLQRPLLRPLPNGGFQVVFGHYRLAALGLIGEREVTAEIQDMTDAQVALASLEENSKRVELRPIEQYRAWQHALNTIPTMTIQALADGIGMDRSTVSNHLRLLRLPAVVLDRVDAGELSPHAAREFLCLGSTDGHTHEEDMAWVIDDIAKSAIGTAPDWRVGNVRRLIRNRVVRADEQGWRPLEDKAGDVPTQTYEAGGASREPSFVVADFEAQYPNDLHRIPRYLGDTSRLWTCNVKAWQRAQTMATRAQNQANKGQGTASVAPPTSPLKSKDFAKTLALDPVARQVTAPPPDPVSGETVDARKPAQLERAVAQLDATQRAALGTRADPVRLKRDVFHASIDERGHHYEARLRAPSYLPDLEECRQRCVQGAAYGQWDASGSYLLYCLNEACYQQKLDEGRRLLREQLAQVVATEDSQDAALVNEIVTKLNSSLGLVLAAVLSNDHRPRTFDQLSYNERQDIQQLRAATLRLQELTGVDFTKGFDRTARLLEALAKAKPRVQQQEIAAQLLVYEVRRQHPNGVAVMTHYLRTGEIEVAQVQEPEDEEENEEKYYDDDGPEEELDEEGDLVSS